MLKLIKSLSEAEISHQVLLRMGALLSRVPSIEVTDLSTQSVAANSDLELAIVRNRREYWRLRLVVRQSAQPREVSNEILRIKSESTQMNSAHPYWVLAAPFISDRATELCAAAGIGTVDLVGNAYLAFGDTFIERRVPGNPFYERRELKSLFTPKASQVLRVLLTPPLRAWKVTDLAAEAGVSVGQVSNVRRHLERAGFARKTREGTQIESPTELIERWAKANEAQPMVNQQCYTYLHGNSLDEALRTALSESDSGASLTLAAATAASWIAPFARIPTNYVYADAVGRDLLVKHLHLKEVATGGNVILLDPSAPGAFAGRIEAAPGIWTTGLVRTWLDLRMLGERGEEAAEHLMSTKLAPAWRSAS